MIAVDGILLIVSEEEGLHEPVQIKLDPDMGFSATCQKSINTSPARSRERGPDIHGTLH